MTSFYQKGFDLLFQFSKQLPGGRISERMAEWEESAGHHRVTHTNHMVFLEFVWNNRPVLVTFQDDPSAPDRPGLEIFLTNKKIPNDCLLRVQTFVDIVWPFGRIRSPLEKLSHRIVGCCKSGGKDFTTRLLANPQLEGPLDQIAWNAGFTLNFQEGGGLGLHVPRQPVLTFNQETLELHVAQLAEILLLLEI